MVRDKLNNNVKNCIMEKLAGMHEEILQFTQELVKIPTENPPGRYYKECIEIINKKLQEFNLATKIIKVKKSDGSSYPRYCLIASYGKGEKTIYFHGHYDVVPAVHKSQFTPQVYQEKLFGRGASDMKGGLVAMIYAVRILQCCEVKLDGRICLVIVPDEETGGTYGTKYLFNKGFIKKNSGVAMFMPEPTSGAIWNACRGALSLLLRVKGKAVHVTLQHQGINAFEKMIHVANALLKLKAKVEKRKTSFNVGPGKSKNSILMLGGSCRCGTNFNIVPGECSLTVERRINPEEDFNKEKATLFNLLSTFQKKEIDLEIEILQEGESAGIASNHDVTKVLVDSVKTFTGSMPPFRMCPGLLEIRFYIKNGIPAFAYGPGLLSVSHGPDEFITIQNIYNCAAVYALTAGRLLSKV